MTDPRTDFFADGASSPASDQDARTAFFASEGQTADATGIDYSPQSGNEPVLNPKGKQPELIPMLVEGGKGFAQSTLHGFGTLADVATGTAPGKGSYAEKLASLVDVDPSVGGQVNPNPVISSADIGKQYDKRFGTGPAAQTFKERIPQALEAISTAIPIMRGAGAGIRALAAPGETPGPFENSPQSMGAARSVDPRLAAAPPELQRAVQQAAQNTGGAVNPTAYENHLEAGPHGVQLMEGQATRDPAQFSYEQSSTHPDIVKRISDQNGQITDAFDTIRQEASPGAVQNNPIENGQIAVDALKAYDEPVKADIDAKYDAARAASAKGDLQMDGSSFVSDANAALKPQSKFRFLPSTVKGIMDDVAGANGKMTLDDYQAYETQMGNEIAKARTSGDGNAVAAITKVRDSLLKTNPVDAETAQAKALFDTARSAAKARFDELDADPAYRAAVDDIGNRVRRGEPSALADSFLDKYALGTAPKANVDRFMAKLDPEAQQAVAAHTLSTIRKGAIPASGTVTPTGFMNALNKYTPKLGSLVSPETQESLESLGRVVQNAKTPPPGHFVNYSKSGVIMNAAQGAGEAALNAKTLGMGVPFLKNMLENKAAQRALAPGAGLTKLPTPPPGSSP